MSARLLTRCLAPAALLAAGLLAPGLARPADRPCPCHHAKAKLVPVAYNVADLVIPITSWGRVADVQPEPCGASATPAQAPTKTLEDQLMRLIANAVEPSSWQANGGPGMMDYHPLGMALVISQTPAVHRKIAKLLDELRRLQDVEVAVEVRLISVSEGSFERVGIDFNSNPPKTCESPAPCPVPPSGVAFLNDKQVYQFMKAAQGDRRTNVMQAPKLTVLNGQASVIRLHDQQSFVTGLDVVQAGGQVATQPKTETVTTGLEIGVQPVVSLDRRYVRLKLDVCRRELSPNVPLFPVVTPVTPVDGGQPVVFTQFVQQPTVSTQRMERAVAVPDGGTVLLDGWKSVREVRNEYGPPVLSKIPYVNRLFKNVGYGRESEHVLVMVTPRVIVNEEEEAKPTHACPCPCPCDPPCACPCPSKCAAKSECCEAHAPCCAAGHDAVKAKVAELMKRFSELYKEGRYKEAETYAAVAHELDPDDGAASAAVHMARAHARHHGAWASESETDGEGGELSDAAPEVKDRAVAELLRKYHQACAKARKLAERALTIDPTCFSKEKAADEQTDKHGEQ
jgi:hypothetical protein